MQWGHVRVHDIVLAAGLVERRKPIVNSPGMIISALGNGVQEKPYTRVQPVEWQECRSQKHFAFEASKKIQLKTAAARNMFFV